MFTKEQFTEENFDKGLVSAIGDRLDNGMYTDAIIAGGKYLTEVLREKGQVNSDGVALVGQVLGGNAPLLPLNKLQTQSEQDEQKGILQIVMGFYTGIRNPRHHDHLEDSEEFCIRILVLIDTLLQYLNREVQEFDVTAIVNRIYEPHFVPSREYAQALMSDVPKAKALDVFKEAFGRRAEGKMSVVQYAFQALTDMMSEDDVASATNMIGKELESATEDKDIADLLRLLKPDAWPSLKKNVRLRLEHIIIEDCRKGQHDVFGGPGAGDLGTWANTFGPDFHRLDDLATVLHERLLESWYSQNYVAKHFINVLPRIFTGTEMIKKAAEALAYAALDNQAKVLRTELLKACGNYPKEWRDALRVAVQERRHNDENYAVQVLMEVVDF